MIAVGTGSVRVRRRRRRRRRSRARHGRLPRLRNGQLAFTLNGVWVANERGAHRRHIVPRFADYITYTDPTWAPDGEHIAYVRVDNGHETSELWIVRADGQDLHGLSIVHVADMPAWSPNGKWIAYVRRRWAERSPVRRLWETPPASPRRRLTGLVARRPSHRLRASRPAGRRGVDARRRAPARSALVERHRAQPGRSRGHRTADCSPSPCSARVRADRSSRSVRRRLRPVQSASSPACSSSAPTA